MATPFALRPTAPPTAPLPFGGAWDDADFAPALPLIDARQTDPFSWTEEDIAAYDAQTLTAAKPALELVPPRKRSLRDCVAGVEGIADAIEQLDDADLDEETRDELAAALMAELAGTKAKCDAVASTLAMFEHAEQSAELEATRLEKRAEFYARQRERLEGYVLQVLETFGIERLDGETNSLVRRLNPAKVVIVDESAIPVSFLRTPEPAPPPAPRPDKVLIGKALKANREVPGCVLARDARLIRS